MKLPFQPSFIFNMEEKLRGALTWVWEDIVRVINGQISFSSPIEGPTGPNIDGMWVTGTSHATPNTEFTVVHNLGRIPAGFIVMNIDKAAIFYDSGTTWTDTEMYLKANVATVVFAIFVV